MSRSHSILIGLLIGCLLFPALGAKKKKQDKDAGPQSPTAPAGAAVIVPLPSAAEGVAVGGGGKYLILYLKKAQQVAVFDVTQRAVTKLIPVPSADVSIAAGSKKLFIGLKDLGQIQKWDLTNFTHEGNLNVPEGGIHSLAMGADADGPLIVLGSQSAKKTWMVETRSMRIGPFRWKNWDNGGAWGPVHTHVSFDGSAAVGCGGGWAGIDLALLGSEQVICVDGGGYVNGSTLVSGDGALIFPDNGSVIRSDLSTKVEVPPGKAFPADDPAYCVSFDEGAKPELRLFFTADLRTAFTLTDLPELAGKTALRRDQQIHLIPRYESLVTLNDAGTKLSVRHFALAEALAAQGIDYLFVDSAPLAWVLRGGSYRYPIHVQSKRGMVKYALQSGPRGMHVTPEGVLQWTAGDNLAGDAKVIVEISDASGATIFHTFQVAVVERGKSRVATSETTEKHQVIPQRTTVQKR